MYTRSDSAVHVVYNDLGQWYLFVCEFVQQRLQYVSSFVPIVADTRLAGSLNLSISVEDLKINDSGNSVSCVNS